MTTARATEAATDSPLTALPPPAMSASLEKETLPADDLERPRPTLFSFARDGVILGYDAVEVYSGDATPRPRS